MVDKKTGLKPKVKNPKPKVDVKVPKAAGEAVKVQPEETKTVKVEEPPKRDAAVAKAGKRSPKAIKESEAEVAKAARKAAGETVKTKTQIKKPPRSRIERAGKKYREAAKLIDRQTSYDLGRALGLAIKTSPVKFDATVELHINLGVDPTQADQNIRGTVALPAGTGKTLRIAVLAAEVDSAELKAIEPKIIAGDELLAQLEKGQIKFDLLIAAPAMMSQLGKHAKLLGPKGLMPSPKSGTVSADVAKAVTEAKAGKIEFRVDTAGIIHVSLGKVSFGADKLKTNADAVLAAIRAAKPSGVKANYLKSAYVSSTMGPSIRIDLAS